MDFDMGAIIAALAAIAAVLFFYFRKGTSPQTSDLENVDLLIGPPPRFTGLPQIVSIPPSTLPGRIRYWAAKRSLDPALIWGVVMTESSGDPNAQNPSDPSAGLMQITPLIARAFYGLKGTDQEVLRQLLDSETNLRIGTAFVAHLRNRYAATHPVGEWIQAYNLGETLFDRGRRNVLYGSRVVKFMETWKG